MLEVKRMSAQRPNPLFQALKKKKKKSPIPFCGMFPIFFLIQRELTSFVTHDVTDTEKTILRELLFEVVQLKDESHSQYCFPGSEIFSTFFFFPTANTRKMDCGSGNVGNRPRDHCQKCNHPIDSKGKYSLKWHMLIVLNSKHLFGHPDVGKCHILISWNILSSFRSSFLILIASQISGKFFPTTVYWSHHQSI